MSPRTFQTALVYEVNEMHTSELLVPEPSSFELETVIDNLKRHKSPGTEQVLVELIQAGGR
jgi:hypothetical protein